MSNFDDFFGVSGGVGIYPTLIGDITYNHPTPTIASNDASNEMSIIEGFSGDGDYVTLPTNTANNLIYKDNASSLVFSKAKTDLNAAVDAWCGFMFDNTDSLIYVMGVDIGTVPDTFYLASYNSAGTRVDIGNAQVTTDFATSPKWGTDPTDDGACNLYRAADGTGNFFLRVQTGAGIEEAEFSDSTGALVTDTTKIILFDGANSGSGVPHKTTNGDFVGGFSDIDNASTQSTGSEQNIYVQDSSRSKVQGAIPVSTGVPVTSVGNRGLIPMQWKNKIVFSGSGTSSSNAINLLGVRAVAKTVFDTWVTDLKTALGLS